MNDDDDSDFARMMPGVRRLHHDRINVYRHRGEEKFRPRDPANEKKVALHHPRVASAPLDTYFHGGLQKKLQRRIRQGLIRPEASLDLHGYRQHEALEILPRFIDDALMQGMRMVVIIHGQGYRSQSEAVLRPLVQSWLATRAEVLAWCPAQPRDGAAGASYVYLRGAA